MKIDKLPSARLSRKIGRLDGREGLPELQAEKPHSPFLEELATIGEQHFAQTTESLNAAFTSLSTQNGQLKAKKTELLQSQADNEKDIAITEDLRLRLSDEYLGNENQSHASKITDRRFLSGAFYYPIILITIIGELVITYPAFESLFGDSQVVAVLTTFAASAMTIAFSYLLGLVLKRNDDKKRLLQRWVLPSVLSSSIFIMGLVVSLSHLRATKFTTEDGTAAIDLGASGSSILPSDAGSDANSGLVGGTVEQLTPVVTQGYEAALTYWWAFALFSFLQLALIVVATLGEYFHYSHLQGEQKRVMKNLETLRKRRESLINEIDQITSTLESTPQKEKQLVLEHSAEIFSIKKKVEARAQAFWGTNIRQRADSPNAKSRRFEAPSLQMPDWSTEQ
jgi:F0F1-type ATP synthase membrane subunit c/vacuolar-type H+-ATPase subunit K